jgi:diguanylate cyclase (GGDEF)-like protein
MQRGLHHLVETAGELSLIALLATLALALYAWQGHAKTFDQWNWLDICSEGGSAMVALWWSRVVRNARPPGRVSDLFTHGLELIALGDWVDFLDEFFKLDHSAWWGHALESGMGLCGTLALTAGLFLWRQEQHWITAQLRRRERLFRDHRAFDRVTHLADAGYLRRQLLLEAQNAQPCALLMVELADAVPLARELGPEDHDRLLWHLGQLLLLNLRRDDLLCRYAGERMAVLLPRTDAAEAQRLGEMLAHAVAAFSFQPTRGGPPPLLHLNWVPGVLAGGSDEAGVQDLLSRLNAALTPTPALSPVEVAGDALAGRS